VSVYAVVPAGDASLAPSDRLADARAAVASLETDDPAVAEARSRIVAFIDEHPDALHRSCEEGHLTGSAMVVDPEQRRFLLLFHAKVRRWLQPGGHADGDANLAAVALKEATEETGIDGLSVVVPAIDLDIHEFRAAGEPTHLHLDVRHLVLASPGAVHQGNHESLGLRWVTIDELDELGAHSELHRLAAAALDALDLLGGRLGPR
jgi:8-oxo-dGTP pyrophosphatase MutT (NUDIX family)